MAKPSAVVESNQSQPISPEPIVTPVIQEATGYIKSAYEKDGKKFIDIDYVQECLFGDFAIKAMLEDNKCLPGTTFEELKSIVDGAWNIGDKCPEYPFGYGSGYCYYRNTNDQVRTLELAEDADILLSAGPYGGEFLDNGQRYRISGYQVDFSGFKKFLEKNNSQHHEAYRIEIVDNSVVRIFKPSVGRE